MDIDYRNKKKIMIFGSLADARNSVIYDRTREMNIELVCCCNVFHGASKKKAEYFYVVEYDDVELLKKIAKRHEVDGIIPTFDAVLETCAILCDYFNLPGNSLNSVNCLLNKSLFRELQRDVNVFCPKSYNCTCVDDVISASKHLSYPIIIKPAQCSASKGHTVIERHDVSKIVKAFKTCSYYSFDDNVNVEEFVDTCQPCVVEGDIFLYKNQFVCDGIRNSFRANFNSLLPMYDVYPPNITCDERKLILDSVKKLLIASNASIGEFNFEGFFTKNGDFFIIEINARQAGCFNPVDIQTYCGVDLTKLLITTAISDDIYFEYLKNYKRKYKILLSYTIFSHINGILCDIFIDDSIKNNISFIKYEIEPGNKVNKVMNAFDAIAKVTFAFDDFKQLKRTLSMIDKLVYPIVK